jgi:hypothetical protein
VPRTSEWFATSPFRARFEAKGRFTDYFSQIPTYVIMTPKPALQGVATILSEHLRGRSVASTLKIAQPFFRLTPRRRSGSDCFRLGTSENVRPALPV